jgi:MFS superfamily sulfate permease-like transporter
VTAAIVVAVGMIAGVLVTVVLSLFLAAVRAAQPRRTFLVRVPGTDSFRGEESVTDGIFVPGLVVYRFDGPLFFASAQLLADDIEQATSEGAAPEPVRWVVLDAESIGDVDSTGAGTLGDLAGALQARGITLALARVKGPIADYLGRAGVLDTIGRGHVYLEVDDAVTAFEASGSADGPGAAA